MSTNSYTWYKCRCEVPSNERTLCKPPRGKPASPRRIGSVEDDTKIPRIYDGCGERYISMKRISGTKCASCTAAAAAAARREMGHRFRSPEVKPGLKRASTEEEDLGDVIGDSSGTIDSKTTYMTPPGTIQVVASPQDLSGEAEEEEDDDGSNEEDYNSDDTITKAEYVFPDSHANAPYEEGRREQTPSEDSQDSNAERINHDDHRFSLPIFRVPRRRIETPSVSSESQSSGDGDQEMKERQFRNKADRKYLRGLRREKARFVIN